MRPMTCWTTPRWSPGTPSPRAAESNQEGVRMSAVNPHAGGAPVIELRDVVKRYGAVEALQATTLSLGVGVNVLLGPSGSGKSTLLRLLTGLSRPSAGEVLLWGQVLAPRTIGPLRRRLGYVIQEGGLFPHLTADANVTLAAL